jgi:hypothetical protein
MATLTTDRSYFLPIKPRITFKSIDVEDPQTYFIYDSFDQPSTPFRLEYLDCDNAMGETGTFNIIIEDSNNVLAKDHLHNTKVFIELGKTQSELQHFLIGFADIMDVGRPRTNFQEYRISGFGSQVQAQELLLLQRQSGKSDNDSEYSVKRLFERAMTERKARPMNREPIDDVTGWSMDISSALKTNYKVINEVFTTLWDYFDRLAALEGCNWYIDYRGGIEKLVAKNPSKNHNGKLIKSGDLRSPNDRADRISYIKDAFNITDDASSNAGVKTRLYTTQSLEDELIKESTGNKGRTTLNKRFIAQQVKIENDQRRISTIKLNMERIGEPESPKSRVNGFVILDDNNTPTGTILGKFYVDISSLDRSDNGTQVEITDIDLKTRYLEGVTSKFWIVFTDRSGIKGDIEDDPDNTIAWHHDGLANTAHTEGNYSATATDIDENDREDPTKANWKVSTNGPQYWYSLRSTIKRLLARTNATAAAKLRYKEAFIDSSFLRTPASANRFLALNLNPMSKVRRTINNLTVTVPNNFIYRPYEYTSFADGKSSIAQDLQIARAGYIISALAGDPQYGTYSAQLTLNGSYNPLIGSCTCE